MPGLLVRPTQSPSRPAAPGKSASGTTAPSKPTAATNIFVKAPPSKAPSVATAKPPALLAAQAGIRQPLRNTSASKPVTAHLTGSNASALTGRSPSKSPPSIAKISPTPSTARPSAMNKISTPAKINPAAGGSLPLPQAPSHEALAELEIDQHAAHIAAHQASATMHMEHALTKIGSVVNVAQSVARNPAALGQITSIASLVASAAAVAGVPGAVKAAQAVDNANVVISQVASTVAPAVATSISTTATQEPTQERDPIPEPAPAATAVTEPTAAVDRTPAAEPVSGLPTVTDITSAPGSNPIAAVVNGVGDPLMEAASILHGGVAASAAPEGTASSTINQGMLNGVLALDGGAGSGAGTTDTYDAAPGEGTWNIVALNDDEKRSSATAGTEDDLYHINAQSESHIERLDDHSGIVHDVAIVSPDCTFLVHMSRLATIPFFRDVQEAVPAPAFYQFVTVDTPSQLKPLASYASDDTRGWDNITEELKKTMRNELHLFLRILYGHRPTLKSWADLDEIYTIMNAFGMEQSLINEVINSGIAAQSAGLGSDLVEYPAAFLNLGWKVKNRKLFLEALAQICGRLVYHGETEKTDGSSPSASVMVLYPELAEAEQLVTKYAMTLHKRVEWLMHLMDAFMWPSIAETFKVTSKKTSFKKARDPTPVMIRADISLGKLIEAMKDYRDYLAGELGRNGRGGGFTNLSGRDSAGGRKKFDWFTELPIAEEDAEESAPGVPFEEFTSDFSTFQ